MMAVLVCLYGTWTALCSLHGLSQSNQQAYEVVSFIILPLLHVKEPRPRKVKGFAQGHSTGKQPSTF